MPVPAVATYSLDILVAAQTVVKNAIDAGGAAGSIKFRSATDVLLAEEALAYPCGTVNGTTGQLVLSIPTNVNAVAAGTAAYAEICNSAGAVKLALPAQAGVSPVSGYVVLNSLSIVAGVAVSVVSATIG